MANASYDISNFLGGEISAFAQGRFDKPDYRTSMNVCLNSFPGEVGAWSRRPGTRHGNFTRGGARGRVIKFDFQQSAAITTEWTDGFVRFRNGAALITGNDTQVVLAVSAANPAVVQTTSAVTWVTGNTLIFPGASTPLLENRQFIATKIDTTHFSLVDALTGNNLDGATLGALIAGATVARIHELATAYTGTLWSGIRAVQAETTDIMLAPTVAPQVLTVATLPSTGVNPVFAIAPAILNDGPYLDPFINGVQATPGTKTGIVSITLSFPAYDSTKAYAAGAFVTSVSINYVSLVDQNVNNTPAGAPSFWATTSAGAAINNGQGFLGTDVGRLVRLFSEPPLWLAATTYAVGNIVTYNPSGQPGASTYWQSLTGSNTGHAPGSDLTNWQVIPLGAAIWTWGKITSLSNVIDRALAGSASIGDMTAGGGLAAAFDGVFVQPALSSAFETFTGGIVLHGNAISLSSYVGKNYSGASDQKIFSATIYPSSDNGFVNGSYITSIGSFFFHPTMTFNLRGKASLPSSFSDGTLLGSVSLNDNSLSPITITSSDQTTAWKYVWISVTSNSLVEGTNNTISYRLNHQIAEVVFFGPPGTGTSSGINVEILGPALLYTSPIITWRLGAYSDTTGWPTCGTYHEGRLWLGGAVPNRFDSCVSNGIVGPTINFAPTDQNGVVAASAAISYVLNSDGVNPIFWMQPDLQGIIMGTQAGEWLVQAPTTGPLSPLNIAARRVTKIGCANVEPRRTEHTNVFVQRYTQKLMEYFSDVYSGKFSAPNIADKAAHIVRTGITELAYQQGLAPIIWGRCNDGSLFGITYKRDTLTTAQGPTFAAWHRHQLGSNHLVESICAGPSVGGNLDTLTMVTLDPITNIRQIELLTDTLDETALLSQAWFLDHGMIPTSTSTTNSSSAGAPYGGMTLNGLWPLNGETVQVFASGLDCGDRGLGPVSFTDFLVTNGSVFVPYGDSISAGSGRGLFTPDFAATATIMAGRTYNSDGQMVRPIAVADSGSRIGPSLGELRRNHRYSMLLSNTLGLSVGATFSGLLPANFKRANNSAIPQLTTFSGVHQDSLKDDYSYDGMICWRISRPWPANVVALAGNIATQDQ